MLYADTLKGTAVYLERIAAPPQARFVAVLEDISRADAPAKQVGRVVRDNARNPPYSFEIAYDPGAIDPSRTYAVRASLYASDGELLFTTDTVAPVLTRGAPGEVELVMRRVKSAPQQAGAVLGAHGLRLPASFTGTLPCADCAGIRHHLNLWPDQTFHLGRTYLDELNESHHDALGRWYADPERNAIVLLGAGETPLQWEVKDTLRLRLLDIEGAPIESDLNYDLTSDGRLAETDLAGLFLGGMVRYMADAAIFEECLTGESYPVAMEGAYPDLERAYLADRQAPGAPLYVHVEGSLLMRPAMEGPDRRSLVVDRFIRTRPGMTCTRHRSDAALTNTYWRIDRLRAQAVTGQPERREPHLVLLDGPENRFGGTVGCNRMVGSYTIDGTQLSFGLAASTMMACPPPLDKLEQALGAALGEVREFRHDGASLSLLDDAGQPVIELTAVYFR